MDKKIILSNQSDSIQKITIISTIQCEKEPNEQYMAKKIQFLQPIDALKFLNTLPQDNHFVYCQKAQIYLKLEKIQQVSKMCQKAFEYNAKCKKCIQNYLNLYQFFTIRKLPLIDNLLKKFENQEIKDDNLYNLLLKMKKIIKTDQQFQDFFNQLKQSGAQFSKISLYQDNNNRTAIAKSSIQKDETILYIPKQKLILLEQARQSLIVKKIHQQKLYLRSPKHCQLTIFLLEQEQLGQQSPYYFYMKHLPNQFQSFPINYKEHELEYLKGSPFLEQIQSKKIDMKRDFQAIISVCPQFKRFSYESFKNFRLIVSSRIFGITVGKNRTDVLAPLADMLNHNVPKQTSWYYSDQYEGFVIKSIKPISKGQQIYDSYGQKCNSRFLLNYGFTLSSNQANQVTIKVPFEQQEQKIQIYSQITLKISKNIQSKEFDELLSILRYSVIHEHKDKKQNIELIKSTPYMGSDLQAQIWQKLEKILETQLSLYPTTLKEDKKLLSSKTLDWNLYNCIVLRKGQKQILHYYLTMSKRLIKYFRSDRNLKTSDQLQEYQSYIKKLKCQ